MRADGFKGVISLLPPVERRGLVLMDPSYEVKSDYREVVTTLANAHRRFQSGIYAIWYPVVERYRIDAMERAVKATGIRNVQRFELGVRRDDRPGMSGSGMLLVNPPWTLFASMEASLALSGGGTGGTGCRLLSGRGVGQRVSGFFCIREQPCSASSAVP